MKQKVTGFLKKFAFSTILTLVLLEIVFRFAGWAIISRMNNNVHSGKTTILCLGDSFTYGVGAQRENSYPMQLQRMFDEKEGCSVRVINRGVPGMNSGLIREKLEENMLKFNPDVVIVMAGVNNSWNQAGVTGLTGQRSIREYLQELLYNLKIYKLARLIIYNVEFKRKYSKSPSNLPAQYDFERSFKEKGKSYASRKTVSEGGIETTLEYKPGNNPVNSGMFIMIIKNDYREITRIIKRHGAKLVIMTYPNKGQGHVYALNNYIKEIAMENNISIIDNEKYFFENIPKSEYLKHFQVTGGHPVDEGYSIAAKNIFQKLYAFGYTGNACFSGDFDK